MDKKLNGKIALVTGASRGIGSAIAKLFGQEGATVIVNYISDKESAEKVVKDIVNCGGSAISIQADIGNPKKIDSLFKQIKDKYGKLDILVNNAGIMKPQGPLDMVWDDALNTLIVNAIAPMFCAREAMKIMIDSNTPGTIINITSVRGLEHAGLGGNLAYSAAKAALNNFTGSLAKEWDIKKHKIRVNAVAPGYTNTNLREWDNKTIEKKSQETALGKILDPTDIANAVLFLASDEANGITGEILVVDAGLKLK